MTESTRAATDQLVRALARYVEALERRYPNGHDQMRREALDSRAKITRMSMPKRSPTA